MSRYRTWYKLNKEVLGPSQVPGTYNEQGVDCPFVFWHNDRYYMLHVGFDGIGYQTALAQSTDLVNWTDDTVIFKRGEGASDWDKGGRAGVWILKETDLHQRPVLKKVDGKYWMIYHSYPDPGYEEGPAQMGLAFTEDESLLHWETLDTPIFSWKDGEAWERGGLYKGCLLEHEGLYYLFYNAKDQDEWPWHEETGLAVSKDMIHWERWKENPLLHNTEDAWDSLFCSDPYVVWDGTQWVMFYYGYDQLHAREGIAYSEDLLHWQKDPNPIMGHGEAGAIDDHHCHKPSVLEKDGVLYHYYCAVDQNDYRCISLAVSDSNVCAQLIAKVNETGAKMIEEGTKNV